VVECGWVEVVVDVGELVFFVVEGCFDYQVCDLHVV
jgi:hypothetical protein